MSPDGLHFRYHLVEFVAEHLIDMSFTFDGDLQEAVVLAIVGQAYMQELKSGVGDPASITRSVNASRIADITHIPRQTVRRKLDALSKRGWIEQDAQKNWRIVVRDGVSVALGGLAGLDARGIQRGIRLAAAYKQRV